MLVIAGGILIACIVIGVALVGLSMMTVDPAAGGFVLVALALVVGWLLF